MTAMGMARGIRNPGRPAFVIGDSGSGSEGQYAVGEAIAEVCDRKDEFVDVWPFLATWWWGWATISMNPG